MSYHVLRGGLIFLSVPSWKLFKWLILDKRIICTSPTQLNNVYLFWYITTVFMVFNCFMSLFLHSLIELINFNMYKKEYSIHFTSN